MPTKWIRAQKSRKEARNSASAFKTQGQRGLGSKTPRHGTGIFSHDPPSDARGSIDEAREHAHRPTRKLTPRLDRPSEPRIIPFARYRTGPCLRRDHDQELALRLRMGRARFLVKRPPENAYGN